MDEIAKLRVRLKNVQKNVTEYRMTVSEAKSLLQEIDDLIKPAAAEKHAPVVAEQVIITRVLDGGTF
jgi:hypothetical protein